MRSGGGARAAYQVGMLRAISRIRRQALGPVGLLTQPANPFWRHLRHIGGCTQRDGAGLSGRHLRRCRRNHRAGLGKLQRRTGLPRRFPGCDPQRRAVARGQLHAVAVAASSYTNGEHCTFYDSAVPISPWQRSQRLALPGPITQAHLLASSAIPFVFPATALTAAGHAGWVGRCARPRRCRRPSTWVPSAYW